MASSKKNICIIPARDGSKRIHRKNLRSFCGKPLVYWTIEAAITANIFDDIILSTDSLAVLAIGRECGLDTDKLRPDYLASDTAKAEDVIAYHIKNYSDINICYLQPTSPLRRCNDILESYSLLRSKSLDGVISVCEHPIPKNWIYEEGKNFAEFMTNVSNKRSQDYAKGFVLNGAIYWCTSNAFLKCGTHLLRKNVEPYVMPIDRSIDIDEELDFEFAEFIKRQNG